MLSAAAMRRPTEAPVTRESIRAAHRRIAPHVRRTPVWTPAPGAFGHDGPVSLKLELFQHAGSFKARGAFNTLLSHAIPPAGVAAASGGNHGAAVAYAAKRLGVDGPHLRPGHRRAGQDRGHPLARRRRS